MPNPSYATPRIVLTPGASVIVTFPGPDAGTEVVPLAFVSSSAGFRPVALETRMTSCTPGAIGSISLAGEIAAPHVSDGCVI